MTFRPLAPLRRSCALVEVTRVRDGKSLVSRGTAYVVAPDQVVTCAHVVQSKWKAESAEPTDTPDPHPIAVRFTEGDTVIERTATIVSIDGDADFAILKLSESVPFPALELAQEAPADMTRWAGFGAKSGKDEQGRPAFDQISGLIVSTNATHATHGHGNPALTLLAPDLAEEAAAHGNALAGAPILVNGPTGWVVIGHVREPVIRPNSLATPLAGLVCATPAGPIREGLDTEDPGWPTRAASPYHAFMSIREADRAWAENLQERLQAGGFRVYLTSHETASGTDLSTVEAEALAGARAAILVYSQDWERSGDHAEETKALRIDGNATHTLVIRLDGAVVPSDYAQYTTYDFESQGTWDEDTLDLLKAKLVAGTAEGMQGLPKPWRLIEAASQSFADEIRAARRNHETVQLLARAWMDSGMPGDEVPRRAARALVGAGKPDVALKLLEHLGEGRKAPRVERVRALALSRSGQTDKAISLLEDLRKDGQLDARTAAQFASAYKQKWLETGQRRRAMLTKSYEAYLEAYDRDPEGYRGINVATTARLLGATAQSTAVATEVLRTVLSDASKLDKWNKAVLGEAYLLLGFDPDAAVEWYGRAALEAKTGEIVTMRKQARLVIKSFDDDERFADLQERIEEALYVPGLLGFAGPALREGTPYSPSRARFVKRRLAQVIREHDVGLGMCALATETDVLFAEGVLDYGGSVEALLPFHLAGVREHLIAPHWHDRFNRVLRHKQTSFKALSTTVVDEAARAEAIDASIERLIDALLHEGVVLDDATPGFVVIRSDSSDSGHPGAKAAQCWVDEGREDQLTSILLSESGSGAGTAPPPTPASDATAEEQEVPPEQTSPESEESEVVEAEEEPVGEAAIAADSESANAALRASDVTRTFSSGPKTQPSEAQVRLETGEYNKRHAVIVGIDAYDEWTQLNNAVNDALGFAEEIVRFGFEPPTVLTNQMATTGGIREAIEDDMVSRVEPDDLFVLFFAGHGHTVRDGGFLVPVEASKQLDKVATLIGMEQVVGWVRKLRSRHVLYIFDACFSGSATLDTGISMRAKSGDARWVMTAGTATQEVLDGGADGHSVFTDALLQGLRTQGGDQQRFSALHLYDHVEKQVRKTAADQQTPSFGTLPGHGGGLIWFQAKPPES